MKYTIDLKGQTVAGPYLDKPEEGASAKLSDFIDRLSPKIPFKTGLLAVNGSGLLSYQRAFGHEQYVYQIAPAVERVKWGYSERDPNAKLFEFAMPYRIIVADFVDGGFLGARHYWSVNPIYSWDQPLFCVPLPNTNTTGYSGNTVGWICLYHRHDTTKMTSAERIEYFLSRVNGVAEPYNDANMSSTDGTRFYGKQLGKDNVFASAVAWAKKTKDEGLTWVLDESILIPMTTAAPAKTNHNDRWIENGTPYTVGRAANEPYHAYYGDPNPTKYFMMETKDIPENVLGGLFMGGPVAAAAKIAPKTILPTDIKQFFRNTPFNALAITDALGRSLRGPGAKNCSSCNERVFAPDMKTLIVSYNTDLNNQMINIEHGTWCQDCLNNYARDVKYHGWVRSNLVVTAFNGDYILGHEAVSCNYCNSITCSLEQEAVFVYKMSYGVAVPSRCRHCWTGINFDDGKPLTWEQGVKLEYMTNVLMDIGELKSHTIKELSNEDGTLKVVDREVWMHNTIKPCRCGMFAAKTNLVKVGKTTDVCRTCVDKDGCYAPAFDFQNVPVEVSTSALASK